MALNGNVVAVTGGFGQLGVAVVQAALEAGARVAALGHGKPPTDSKALGSALHADPATLGE